MIIGVKEGDGRRDIRFRGMLSELTRQIKGALLSWRSRVADS